MATPFITISVPIDEASLALRARQVLPKERGAKKITTKTKPQALAGRCCLMPDDKAAPAARSITRS